MSNTNAPMYGGQAVIEGVMMRGAKHFAVAARRPDGTIAVTCEPVPKILRPAWQKLPLLRGAFAVVDSMTLGTRALFWAAKVAEEGVVGREKSETVAAVSPTPNAQNPKSPPRPVADIAIGGAMATGLLMAIFLFKVLPQLGIEALKQAGFKVDWRLGLADAAIRFTILFGYIGLVGRMKHVARVFAYHGAEHKVINALEAHGVDSLRSVTASQDASRLHPRCGTSFLVIVVVLSVLAAAPFYGQPFWIRAPLQILMLFPVAGVGFELLRLAGKYRNNPVADAFSRPGMWTQLLTTREPDDSQIEVALASLNAVLDAEKKESR